MGFPVSDPFGLAAKAARDEALQRVEENANVAWSNYMLELVRQIALTRKEFTSDHVYDLFRWAKRVPNNDIPDTHEHRAFGPVMIRAAKAGFCRKADKAPVASNRESLHASPRAVWKSLIYRGY